MPITLHVTRKLKWNLDPGRRYQKIGKQRNMDIRQLIKECLKESEDEKRRKKNIIVHKLPEAENDRFEERRNHDQNFANTLVKEVLMVDVDVMEVRRLGRRNNEDPKRPLLISFANDWDQRKVVNSLYRLKNAAPVYRNLRVTNDLSKEERTEFKQLVQEAKNLTALDKGGNFFYIVRNKEIMKVKRRPAAATTTTMTEERENKTDGGEGLH